MRMHPLDRLAIKSRRITATAGIFAIPVAFLSYVASLKLMYDAWPLWVFFAVFVAHVFTWLVLSMLDDLRSGRPLPSEPAQSDLPEPPQSAGPQSPPV